MKAPVPEPSALGRQLSHALPKLPVGPTTGLVAHHRATRPNEARRPPLAHRENLPQLSDRGPLRSGRQNFFDRRSFRPALSSIASARRRFSLLFSSSSPFSRRASEMFRPPYLAFHA